MPSRAEEFKKLLDAVRQWDSSFPPPPTVPDELWAVGFRPRAPAADLYLLALRAAEAVDDLMPLLANVAAGDEAWELVDEFLAAHDAALAAMEKAREGE